MGLLAADFTKTGSSAASGAGTPTFTGDPAIDALISTFQNSVKTMAASGRKSLIQSKKALKVQTKAASAERDAYLQQLNALTVQPAPGISSLSSPEVMQAQRQVSIDAAARKGLRKSIIAGNMAPSQGVSPTRNSIIPQIQ